MKASGDPDGLWAILLGSLRCVTLFGQRISHRYLIEFDYRNSTPFQHIPWIGKLLLLSLGDKMTRLTRLSNERVDIRIRSGSTTHDLFYHFVSYLFVY